jgi:hypothetical protein
MKTLKTHLFAALTLGLTLGICRAELPPDVYESMQAKSPEALMIKVRSVNIAKRKQDGGMRSDINAKAEVRAVTRSASGLRVGDVIRISYSHSSYTTPMVGPSEPDILRKGGTYPAFLAKNPKDGFYTLEAGGYSFRSLK